MGSIAEGLELHCHPDTPCLATSSIQVDVARNEFGQFTLRFVLTGDIKAIRIPAPTSYSTRSDELWRTTCFEAFLRVEPVGAYLELNLAPSTGWAAYGFSSYRTGMNPGLPIDAPPIDIEIRETLLELTASLDLSEISALSPNEMWRVGLSAVIEETDGTKSYWALRHPPGKPDFHHPDCFALELAAPERT